ncbi:MAG TPA: Gfo/Idh/MocA family oxidoreductase, partial [Pyrinomonadaceae bacterium]
MFNFGIIGGGGISDTHARAASEIDGVGVSAFFGGNKEKVERLASKYGGMPYDNLDAFLSHKPMDAVIIGSPSGLHSQEGIECARRGLHVLVEKPIDVTIEKADSLI